MPPVLRGCKRSLGHMEVHTLSGFISRSQLMFKGLFSFLFLFHHERAEPENHSVPQAGH